MANKEEKSVPVKSNLPEIETVAAREQRRYLEDAVKSDTLREMLRHKPDSERWVYSIQIRWPKDDRGEYLLVAKAIQDGEPVVAFHSDSGLWATLYSFGGRMRAGRVAWREDEYPPSYLAEHVAYIEDNFKYLRSKGIIP